MSKEYGYARISRRSQNIERQIRNITVAYPEARIYQEAYTGTKIQGRKELEKLLSIVKPGDTIIFDSVSRMSREADAGIKLYMELYDKGVNLVFLKESYINTEVYKSAIEQTISKTGNEIADVYIEATNKVIKMLAEKQILKAFEQAEKEVQDLHKRTSEGIDTARIEGKQIGQKLGAKLTTKKSVQAKEIIRKYSKDFDGSLEDKDVLKLADISRNSFYKYKREIREEMI